MVMTKNDEQLIRQFMQDNKLEVADNGFSRRVMRRLPLRPKEISDLLTAVGIVVGCILFYVSDGLGFFLEMLYGCLDQLNSGLSQGVNLSTIWPALLVLAVLGIHKVCSLVEE